MIDFAKTILLFTDGACSGNPGPGGYGTVIALPSGDIKELGAGRSETTNNRMEMMAVLEGLKSLENTPGDLAILTDSTYVIRGITQWIWGWKKRGWKSSSGSAVANRDLWESLDFMVNKRKNLGAMSWKYLRGHSGTPGNERCDEIAVGFTKKQWVDLYEGPLLEYSVAIHDLPDNMELPPMKKPGAKKKQAHSYLSYVNGNLERHSSWKECEAKVKGRPGAKFKKSTSAKNEIEIAKDWGLTDGEISKSGLKES